MVGIHTITPRERSHARLLLNIPHYFCLAACDLCDVCEPTVTCVSVSQCVIRVCERGEADVISSLKGVSLASMLYAYMLMPVFRFHIRSYLGIISEI